jgi:hypothetical protein
MFFLGGFVADSAPELSRDLWWNFGHVLGRAHVVGGLSQDVLFGLTPYDKVTLHASVFAVDYFWHVGLLCLT